MSEELRNCFDCVNMRRLPGSAHVNCADPPKEEAHVGGCGPGRGGTRDLDGAPNFDSVEERTKAAEEMARYRKVVVRCLWPGCGPFPGYMGLVGFDAFSVKACHNFKEKEGHEKN